ncbi:helicase associated domain-containing protein [Gammaproteobacteria bacterium]|nr:helicase associated domain-containing protein [Gammaproteobacteria bacterium]
MGSKEVYLYGTLLALADEQSDAISKLTQGGLGWWEKNRIQARGEKICGFIEKILEYKASRGSKNCSEEVKTDLEKIKLGNFPKNYSEACYRTLGSYTSTYLGGHNVLNDATTAVRQKKSDLFEMGFPYLEKFHAENGHAAVPISRYIMAGTSNDDEVIDLASWLNNQLREELSEVQIALMETLGADLDNWFENCRRLAEFKKRNNHVEVPFQYVTESGAELGVWLQNQREGFRKNELSDEKAETLRKLGVPFIKRKENKSTSEASSSSNRVRF